eukprot:jgi/Mesvir1/13009/Mv06012-RA.1
MALLSHKKWLHRHLSSGPSEELEPKVGEKRAASNGNGFAKLSSQDADLRSQPLRKRVLSDVRDNENGEGKKFSSYANASGTDSQKAWETSSWAAYSFKHGSTGNISSTNNGSGRPNAKRENGNGLDDEGNRSSKSLSNLASPQSNAESGRGWRRGESSVWGADEGEGIMAAGVEPPGADILDKIDVVSLPAVGNYSAYRQFPYFRRVCSAFAGSSSRVASRAESAAKSWTAGDLMQLVGELRRMGRESRERRALLIDGVALLDGNIPPSENNNNDNDDGGAAAGDASGKALGKGKRRPAGGADIDDDEGDDTGSMQDGGPSMSGLMSPGGEGADGGMFSPTSSSRGYCRKNEGGEGGHGMGDVGPDTLGDAGYSERKDRKGHKGEPAGYGAKQPAGGPGGFSPGSTLVSPGRKLRAAGAPGPGGRVEPRRKDSWHGNDALKDFEGGGGRAGGRREPVPLQKQAARGDMVPEGPHRPMARREGKELPPPIAVGGREGKLAQEGNLNVCRPSAESAHLDKPLAPPASRYGSLEPARDVKREDASGSRPAASLDTPLASGTGAGVGGLMDAPRSGLDVLAATLAEASGEDYDEDDARGNGGGGGYGSGGGGHKAWDGAPWAGAGPGRSSLDRQLGGWAGKAGKRWRSDRPPLPPMDAGARGGAGDARTYGSSMPGDGRRGGGEERGMAGGGGPPGGRSGGPLSVVSSGAPHLAHHGEEQHRQRRREGNSYVCAACESTGELVLCGGPCLRAFHRGCLHPSELERIACLGAGTTSPNTPPSSTGPMAGHAIPPHMLLGMGGGGGEEGEAVHDGSEDMHGEEGGGGTAGGGAGDGWGGNAGGAGGVANAGSTLTSWRCADCRQQVHECFQCKVPGPDRLLRRCSGVACGKYYHESCLARLRLTKYDGPNRFYCPLHACERCGDSGRSKQSTRCVRCPTAYHLKCLPLQQPRCHQVTRHRIICSKHGPYSKDAPRQMAMPPPLEEPLHHELDPELEEEAVEEAVEEVVEDEGEREERGAGERGERHGVREMEERGFGIGWKHGRDGERMGREKRPLREKRPRESLDEDEDGRDAMDLDMGDGDGVRCGAHEGRPVKLERHSPRRLAAVEMGRASEGDLERHPHEHGPAGSHGDLAWRDDERDERGGSIKDEDSYEEGEARDGSQGSDMMAAGGGQEDGEDREGSEDVAEPSGEREASPDRQVKASQESESAAPDLEAVAVVNKHAAKHALTPAEEAQQEQPTREAASPREGHAPSSPQRSEQREEALSDQAQVDEGQREESSRQDPAPTVTESLSSEAHERKETDRSASPAMSPRVGLGVSALLASAAVAAPAHDADVTTAGGDAPPAPAGAAEAAVVASVEEDAGQGRGRVDGGGDAPPADGDKGPQQGAEGHDKGAGGQQEGGQEPLLAVEGMKPTSTSVDAQRHPSEDVGGQAHVRPAVGGREDVGTAHAQGGDTGMQRSKPLADGARSGGVGSDGVVTAEGVSDKAVADRDVSEGVATDAAAAAAAGTDVAAAVSSANDMACDDNNAPQGGPASPEAFAGGVGPRGATSVVPPAPVETSGEGFCPRSLPLEDKADGPVVADDNAKAPMLAACGSDKDGPRSMDADDASTTVEGASPAPAAGEPACEHAPMEVDATEPAASTLVPPAVAQQQPLPPNAMVEAGLPSAAVVAAVVVAQEAASSPASPPPASAPARRGVEPSVAQEPAVADAAEAEMAGMSGADVSAMPDEESQPTGEWPMGG